MRKLAISLSILAMSASAFAGRRDGRAIHWIEYLLGLLQ